MMQNDLEHDAKDNTKSVTVDRGEKKKKTCRYSRIFISTRWDSMSMEQT